MKPTSIRAKNFWRFSSRKASKLIWILPKIHLKLELDFSQEHALSMYFWSSTPDRIANTAIMLDNSLHIDSYAKQSNPKRKNKTFPEHSKIFFFCDGYNAQISFNFFLFSKSKKHSRSALRIARRENLTAVRGKLLLENIPNLNCSILRILYLKKTWWWRRKRYFWCQLVSFGSICILNWQKTIWFGNWQS